MVVGDKVEVVVEWVVVGVAEVTKLMPHNCVSATIKTDNQLSQRSTKEEQTATVILVLTRLSV